VIPDLLGMSASGGYRPSALARQLLVIVLYVAAARLMMHDPWFTSDTFTWRQSSVITLLGLLMVSAIAFEWHLLGVSKGLNLVGQIVLAYPFTLFVARLLGRPWHQTDTGGVLGALITNLAGQQALRLGELLLARVPLVRSIYSILKQVVETIASNDSSSFKEAVLVEYPGKGLWVIGFITSRTPDAEVLAQAPDVIGVLVPSSPNPAMGQLVFVTPERIRPLDMPVEKAAKLVIDEKSEIESAASQETRNAVDAFNAIGTKLIDYKHA
jgi:uncharacterized membrane protein